MVVSIWKKAVMAYSRYHFNTWTDHRKPRKTLVITGVTIYQDSNRVASKIQI
jgi:hypothetical protein